MSDLLVNCTLCGKEMKFDRNSYGDLDCPFCFDCWGEAEIAETDDMYGPGPHAHDLSKTGSFVGSTVLLELPAPDASGWIDLAPLGGWYANWMYKPDDEGPECGVYTHKSNFARRYGNSVLPAEAPA